MLKYIALFLVLFSQFSYGKTIKQEAQEMSIKEISTVTPAAQRETSIFDVTFEEKDKKNRFELSGYFKKEDQAEEYFIRGEENYQTKDFEFSFNTDYTYEKDEDKESNGIINFDYIIMPRFETFLLGSWKYDKYEEITYYYYYGAGAKLSFAKNKYWKSDVSYAPIYETEKYENRDKEDSHLKHSFRYRLFFYFMKPLSCGYTFWYVHRDREDYRTEHILEAKVDLGKQFFLKGNYKRSYNKVDNIRETKIFAEVGIRL